MSFFLGTMGMGTGHFQIFVVVVVVVFRAPSEKVLFLLRVFPNVGNLVANIQLDWIGLDWIGLDWIGLDWIGLDWIG